MTYGLSPNLFVEHGPAIQAAKVAAARRSSSTYLGWRALDENHRIALVEKALAGPANDDGRDGYPIAL